MMDRYQIICLCEQMRRDRCTPAQIEDLKAGQVLVFGSKPNGHHVSGAAKLALERYGAIEGEGEGFFGSSYALPVHKHKTHKMDKAVKRFVAFAKEHSDMQFVVLPVGCGSAGMNVGYVAEMFSVAINASNILLPLPFINALIEHRMHKNEIQFTDYPSYYALYDDWTKSLIKLKEKAEEPTESFGSFRVEMDCSIKEAVDIIVRMCIPTLSLLYPELSNKTPTEGETFWLKPDLSDVSLAVNQLTEGWYQCIRYMLGYDWYGPSLKREDIIRCLKYPLILRGPYFDGYEY